MRHPPAPSAATSAACPALPATDWPADLRRRTPETVLVGVVLNGVAALDLPRTHLNRQFPNPEGLSVLTLLSTVVFGYVTGRFGSEEIEEASRVDPAVGYLTGGRQVSSPTVRRFRRAYRSQIARALFGTLRQVLLAGDDAHPETGREADLILEARRRIEAAVLADTIALDV